MNLSDEDRLREKLRKVEMLFAGAATPGERMAAAEAIERIKKRLADAGRTEKPTEFKITLADGWSRRMFVALCRRYGLCPFRRRGQRYTTVMGASAIKGAGFGRFRSWSLAGNAV